MKKILLSAFALIFAVTSFAGIVETGSAENANLPESAPEDTSTPTFCTGKYITWTGGSDTWYAGGSATFTINDSEVEFKNGPTASTNPAIDGTGIDATTTNLPNEGAYYQFVTKEFGYLYIFGEFDTSQHYVVWESCYNVSSEVSAIEDHRIPYTFVAYDETVDDNVITCDLSTLAAENIDENGYLLESYPIETLGEYLTTAGYTSYSNNNHTGYIKIPVNPGINSGKKKTTYTICGAGTKTNLYGYCFATAGEGVKIEYSGTTLFEGTDSVSFVLPTNEDEENDAKVTDIQSELPSDQFYFDTNAPSGSTLKWVITDQHGTVTASGDNDSFDSWGTEVTGYRYAIIWPTETIILYEGSTYTLTINAYNGDNLLGSGAILELYGGTPVDNPYSDVTVEASPVEKSYLTAGSNTVTLTFSADVTIDKNNTTYDVGEFNTGNTFESIEGSGTEWTLTISSDEIAELAKDGGAVLYFIVAVTDTHDKSLVNESHNGLTDGYLHLTYDVEFVPNWTISPEDGATLKSLSEIVVTDVDGISYYTGDVVILSGNDTIKNATISSKYDKENGTCTFSIDPAITDNGTYTVVIPDSYFFLGDASKEIGNPKTELSYIVEGSGDEEQGDLTATGYECFWQNDKAVQGTEDFYTFNEKCEIKSNQGSVVYKENTYSECLYFATGAEISFTAPMTNMELTLVFGAKDTHHDVNINGNPYTADPMTDEGNNVLYYILTETLKDGGAYTLSKDDPSYLFYINLVETSQSTGIKNLDLQSTDNNVFYNLNGQRVSVPTHGIYIVNGKKILVK